jgi:hypothetical protein
MIVDDEQTNIIALKLILNLFSLQADSSFNGRECIDLMVAKEGYYYNSI